MLDLARLERLFREAFGMATEASAADKVTLNAIDRAVRLMERKSRLLGLDRPAKVDVDFRDVRELSAEECARQRSRRCWMWAEGRLELGP